MSGMNEKRSKMELSSVDSELPPILLVQIGANKWEYLFGILLSLYSIITSALSLWAELLSLTNDEVEMSMDQFIFSIIMWTLGTIAFLLNNLVVYLILKKSTTEIKEYKLYLLNFTVTDIIFSCLLSWTLQPAPIIPGGGALFLGSIRKLGGLYGHIQFTIIAYVFAHSIVSLNYCFIYRYSSLCDAAARRLLGKTWYKIMLFGSGEVACFSIALLIFDMRVSEEVYFGYDYKNSPHANIFLISALLLAPLSCGFNFLCASLVISRLHQYRHQLSHRTYRMHLKLLLALLLQTTVPLILFILPISYVFLSAILLLSGTLTNSFTRYMPIVALALHPIINPCITIMFIEPYRKVILPEFLLRRLRGKKIDGRIVTNVTNTTTAIPI